MEGLLTKTKNYIYNHFTLNLVLILLTRSMSGSMSRINKFKFFFEDRIFRIA